VLLPSFLRTIGLTLPPLPAATKIGAIDLERSELCIQCNTLRMCTYTVSIHTVYLVSDLEGSDNGDPINGIVYCLSFKSRSSHGLGYFSGLVNKCEEVLFCKPKCNPFAAAVNYVQSTLACASGYRVRQSRG
jgi:hypothetical protein